MAICGFTVERCGCGSACWDKHPPEVRDRATALAAGVMWAATGRRYGPCEITIQPCNPPRPASFADQTYGLVSGPGGTDIGSYPQVVIEDGVWSNQMCGGGCTCAARCEVPLPGPIPADGIVEVLVDGDLVDPDAYRVEVDSALGWLLVRVDGSCWPSCARYGTAIPGFEVTLEQGLTIPDPVQAAFETLACEYAKLCTGGDCTLPPRLQSLARQGVTVTMADVADAVGGQIRTGIKVVDDVIAADNPYGRAAPPMVLSPDLPPYRVTVAAAGS